ncbi:UNVERIFIED_CONTAM: hypothetical protein Sindi_0066000, partial [Sesamum indicum]
LISALPPPLKALAISWAIYRHSSSSEFNTVISYSRKETLSSKFITILVYWELSSSRFAACSLRDRRSSRALSILARHFHNRICLGHNNPPRPHEGTEALIPLSHEAPSTMWEKGHHVASSPQ